jgi:GNAT superfamily N-acetyltransferase
MEGVLRSEILKSNEAAYYKQWEKDKGRKQIVIKHGYEDAACVACLSKMDFDPFGDHADPYCLDLIYTLKKYRKRGLATKLIKEYLDKMEISTHMVSPELKGILDKFEWKRINGGATYRSV